MDKKAKDILFKTYWSATGWHNEFTTHHVDFEYAKSKGLMFDPITITKAQLLVQLDEIHKRVNPQQITDAFLCSLTNKRLDWRSALASYANAERLLKNPSIDDRYIDYGKDRDLNILNFERIKFGGVRHDNALYNLMDLGLFSKEDIPTPSDEDVKTFQDVLKTIYNSAPGDTPGKLRDNLSIAFKSSKNERHNLIEILACADILSPLSTDRKEPGKHDWTFALYWRGADKYSKSRVRHYFGSYGIE